MLAGILAPFACASREEELAALREHLRRRPEGASYYCREIPDVLRKLAHRKHRSLFEREMATALALCRTRSDWASWMERPLEELRDLAEKRFNG